MKLKAFLLIAMLHFAALASCAGETPETPVPPQSGEEGYKTIDLSGYRLIFSDEFDGKKMNWNIWAAENPDNIKHETSRGPEAVEVRDGELRLNVRKVNRSEKVKWIAGYVYLKEPLEHNVYIECRFRSGASSGVNNAFWLACKTPPNNTWCNKYEIDIVEARKNVRTGKGSGHLAYHDWKTYPYALDKNGNKCDIAAGIAVEHDFDEYHVWGLWYGENEMIYYLDGEELWRGTTSKTYPDQYYTGVGKAPVWNPLEEQRGLRQIRARGLELPRRLQRRQDAHHPGQYPVGFGLVAARGRRGRRNVDGRGLRAHLQTRGAARPRRPSTDLKAPCAEIALDKTYSLAEDGCIYFSAEITKKPGEELTLTFTDTDNAPVGKVIVDAEGSLLTGITRLTSSKVAASVVQGKKLRSGTTKRRCSSAALRPEPPAANTTRTPSAYGAPRQPMPPKRRSPIFTPIWMRTAAPPPRKAGTSTRKAIRTKSSAASLFSSTTGELSSFGRFRAGRNFLCVTR